MFISIKSLKNYILINTILIFIGITQHKIIEFFVSVDNTTILNFLIVLFIFIMRNIFILNLIISGTKNKKEINNNYLEEPKESFKHEFNCYLLSTTGIESITHIIIKNNLYNTPYSLNNGFLNELIYFIPLSFMFEIIFDFFHYFAHRLLHNKYLYKYLHKTHHKFKHPTAIIAFYQDPIDLIMTNSIPTVLTLYIIPKLSYTFFHLMIVYKMFVEISGHTGKISYPTCSFPQFMWLPKLLNIELYTEDHDLHHSSNNCNYAKRFSLWDKIFKTYKLKM